MIGEPQRSGKSATTGYSKHSQYTAPQSDKWDKWLKWADDNGVIAPALIAYQWVRKNAPQKSYTNKSLAVILKDDCILAKNHIAQELHPFTDHKDYTRNSVPVDRAKIYAQLVANKATLDSAQEATALTVATTWSEATDAPLVSGYMVNKGLVCTHGARWHRAPLGRRGADPGHPAGQRPPLQARTAPRALYAQGVPGLHRRGDSAFVR